MPYYSSQTKIINQSAKDMKRMLSPDNQPEKIVYKSNNTLQKNQTSNTKDSPVYATVKPKNQRNSVYTKLNFPQTPTGQTPSKEENLYAKIDEGYTQRLAKNAQNKANANELKKSNV